MMPQQADEQQGERVTKQERMLSLLSQPRRDDASGKLAAPQRVRIFGRHGGKEATLFR